MTRRSRARRPLAVTATIALALSLGACGGGDGNESDGVAEDTSVEFTGDPVKVMTLAPIDTEALDSKSLFTIAEGAVTGINNAGGVNGHKVELITCNDGFDPNVAAECARDAVEQGVVAMIGGMSISGQAILPILAEADIPWIGPPLTTEAELTMDGSFPITSGVLTMPLLGRRAVEDGCKKIGSVAVQTGNETSDGLAKLVDLGASSAGGGPAKQIRVPQTTTDFSGVAQQLDGYDCVIISAQPAVVSGVIAASASLGNSPQYYLYGGALTSSMIDQLGDALDGTITTSNFPVGSDDKWAEAKEIVGDLADDPNGGWTSVFAQNTWVAYQVFASVTEYMKEFTGANVASALRGTTDVDTSDLTAPLSFAQEFGLPGLNRVFNRQVRFLTVEDGEIVSESDEYVDAAIALQPGS